MQPVIETVHLYKRFGTVTALDDVNIAVARGEFVAIMGSSGSGKTTLMNILSCLDTPTEGKVLLNGTDAAALDEEARRAWIARQSGILELTHNWGSETDPAFHYHNGNSEPRGFGHICISVPDFDAAIRWFDQNNVPYQKRPEDGTMRHIAFIKDPDDYWVEIIKG